MVFSVLMILGALTLAAGRPDGAPSSSCTSMAPVHNGVTNAQSGMSGVNITTSMSWFDSCNSAITVTLSRETDFQGFLCQARTTPNSYTPTGMIDSSMYENKCDAGKAITHSDTTNKRNVQFTWTPEGMAQDFYIVCTIAESKSVYWIKEMSAMVEYTGSDGMMCNSNNSAGTAGQSLLFVAVLSALLKLL